MADDIDQDTDTEFVWGPQEDFHGWEVVRNGDDVFLTLSRETGESVTYRFHKEDAVTVGIALAQAAQDPEEDE